MFCKNCGSTKTIKKGKVNHQQRYRCKECGKTFIDNGNFTHMRHQKHIIGFALDLYFEGMSVRKIEKQIQYLFKVKVSPVSIYKWITKYSTLTKQYTDSLKADLSDIWHVDETAIKIKGKQKWFWEIIDEKTRFMVAEHLSNSRTIKDSKILFKEARSRCIKKPRIIYADGCFAYRKGFNLYFGDCGKYSKLIQNVGINGRVHQNMIERLHGTLKDMIRSRRGMDQMDKTGAMLDGWFVYYNFLRPHSSLGGKTPAQAAGIELNLENRWESLIDLATRWKNEKIRI